MTSIANCCSSHLQDCLMDCSLTHIHRAARDALIGMGIDPEAQWKALELLRGELNQLSTKEKVIHQVLDSHLQSIPTAKDARRKR